MQEPNYQPLQLNARMYQYIRASAITNIDDALVELITNCVDAYTNINNNPNKITVNMSRKNKYIEVIDQAIGMDAASMKVCFLQVGTYASDNIKRGHFSRGAKDISALGDCTFTAIKDNKYSVCKILFDGRGAILTENSNVTDDIRNATQITNNGLHVRVNINNINIITQFKVEDFSYHYALRDILTNPNIEVTFMDTDKSSQQILKYTLPNGEKVVEGDFLVPGYDNITAKFELFVSQDKTIRYSNNMRYNENGILITSSNTIYENSFLQNRNIASNPQSQKIFGRISCDNINTLLKDYENNGASKANPFPIIDSSRLQGLNYQHPFVKQLMLLPIERINAVLVDLEYKDKSNINENLDKAFDIEELHKLNNDIFKQLGLNLVSNFKLKMLGLTKALPIVQNFQKENLDLPNSTPNIKKNNDTMQEQEENAAKLTLNFVDTQINGKYETYANATGIVINIPKSNYVIQKFVLNNNVTMDAAYNDTRFRTHVADIITSALADHLTSNEISKQNLSDVKSSEMLDIANNTFNKNYDSISDAVHKIILE